MQNRFWFQMHSLKVPTFGLAVKGVVVLSWNGVKGVPETYACNETTEFELTANAEGEIEMNRSVEMPVMMPMGHTELGKPHKWDWDSAGHFRVHGMMCVREIRQENGELFTQASRVRALCYRNRASRIRSQALGGVRWMF